MRIGKPDKPASASGLFRRLRKRKRYHDLVARPQSDKVYRMAPVMKYVPSVRKVGPWQVAPRPQSVSFRDDQVQNATVDPGAATVAAAAAAAGGVAAADVATRRSASRATGGRLVDGDGLSKPYRKAMTRAPRGLDAASREFLRRYSAKGYKEINDFARTGAVQEIRDGSPVSLTGAAAAEKSGQLARLQSQLTETLDRNTLPEGTRVYRGMGLKHRGGTLPKTGDVLTDKAAMSTSRSPASANAFTDGARRRGAATLVVEAGGAKGLSVEKLSEFRAEREVLLKPGTDLKVDHVAKGVKRNLFDRRRDYVFASAAGSKAQAPGTVAPGFSLAARAGMVAGPAVAAAQSYQMARNAGASTTVAAGAGVAGGGLAATFGYGLARAAPFLGKTALRVIPAVGVAMAAYGAVQGYRKGGLAGAALGAVGLDAFIKPNPAPGRPRGYVSATAKTKARAKTAEKRSTKQSRRTAQQSAKGGPRGFANRKTQAAAQDARRRNGYRRKK
jgi:hypothetical protein